MTYEGNAAVQVADNVARQVAIDAAQQAVTSAQKTPSPSRNGKRRAFVMRSPEGAYASASTFSRWAFST